MDGLKYEVGVMRQPEISNSRTTNYCPELEGAREWVVLPEPGATCREPSQPTGWELGPRKGGTTD